MDYPAYLLPNPNLKLIDLTCVNDQYLIRYASFKDIIDPDSLKIKDKAICEPSSTNMPDLSTSLLGIFKVDDVYIHVINSDFYEYCSPDALVNPPIHEDDFILDHERGYWFVKIGDIHGKAAEYDYTNPVTQIKETRKAFCTVTHTPAKWNYWHYSIRWFVENEQAFYHQLDSERKKKWYNKLAHKSRALIKFHATPDMPSFKEIDKACYTEQTDEENTSLKETQDSGNSKSILNLEIKESTIIKTQAENTKKTLFTKFIRLLHSISSWVKSN